MTNDDTDRKPLAAGMAHHRATCFTLSPWFPQPQEPLADRNQWRQPILDTLIGRLVLLIAATALAVLEAFVVADSRDQWPKFLFLLSSAPLLVFITQVNVVVFLKTRVLDRLWVTVVPYHAHRVLLPVAKATVGLLGVIGCLTFIPRLWRGAPDFRATLLLEAHICASLWSICFVWFGLRHWKSALRHRRVRSEILSLSNRGAPPDRPCIHIVHWSDIHLAADENSQTIEGGLSPNRAFRDVLQYAHHIVAKADVVLLTGDITDSGSPTEWQAFFESVPECVMKKLIILPGNHDINLLSSQPGVYMTYAETDDRVLRKLRMIRFMIALDHVQGARATVLKTNGDVITVRDYLAANRSDLEAFATCPPQRVFESVYRGMHGGHQLRDVTPPDAKRLLELPQQVWDGLFPMAVDVTQTGPILILIDSNDVASNAAENAFGRLSAHSLATLRRMLDKYEDRQLLIALHHHFHVPNDESENSVGRKRLSSVRAQVQRMFLVLSNAMDLVAALPAGKRSVCFCGHLHIGYHVIVNSEIQVIGAPSTTLGDARDSSAGAQFSSYCIQWDAGGARVVSAENHPLGGDRCSSIPH